MKRRGKEDEKIMKRNGKEEEKKKKGGKENFEAEEAMERRPGRLCRATVATSFSDCRSGEVCGVRAVCAGSGGGGGEIGGPAVIRRWWSVRRAG